MSSPTLPVSDKKLNNFQMEKLKGTYLNIPGLETLNASPNTGSWQN